MLAEDYTPPVQHRSRSRQLAVESAAVPLLEERDLAFPWLDKAYEDRHPWLVMLKATPKVDSLRSDPRFTALWERVAASSTLVTVPHNVSR